MWNRKESPLRIEERFEFEEYSKISKFMGEIDNLCKEQNIYPNISFGKNFVSVTIFPNDENISDIYKEFSNRIDSFYLEVQSN